MLKKVCEQCTEKVQFCLQVGMYVRVYSDVYIVMFMAGNRTGQTLPLSVLLEIKRACSMLLFSQFPSLQTFMYLSSAF